MGGGLGGSRAEGTRPAGMGGGGRSGWPALFPCPCRAAFRLPSQRPQAPTLCSQDSVRTLESSLVVLMDSGGNANNYD